jgi:FeS assembly SUF system protein
LKADAMIEDATRIESEAEGAQAPGAAANGASAPSATLSPEELDRLTDDIIAALKTVYDPEIPADIYELGLIYRIDISDERFITIDMTLTAPGCPVAGEMPGWVETAVLSVPGVSGVKVNMTFDPPWDQSRMSDEARVALDMW